MVKTVLFLLCISVSAWSEINVDALRATRLPEVLFHWTDNEGLTMMEPNPAQLERGGQYAFNNGGINNGSNMYLESLNHLPRINSYGSKAWFTGKISRYVLFAWSNPITGMGNDKESYARATYNPVPYENIRQRIQNIFSRNIRPIEFTSSARVITIKTNPSASVGVLVSVNKLEGEYKSNSAMESEFVKGNWDSDFILHVNLHKDRSLAFQEWIITNPHMVRSFSADPEHARPYIEKELKRLEDPIFRYGANEMVVPDQPLLSHYKEILADTLAEGTRGVSRYFNQFPVTKSCRQVIAN
jgi:hypothetical protein